MNYEYKTVKPRLFEEANQELFLKIRDNTHRLLKMAGAVRLQEAALKNSGDTWTMIACMDRLVELGEITELSTPDSPGQYRVFISAVLNADP